MNRGAPSVNRGSPSVNSPSVNRGSPSVNRGAPSENRGLGWSLPHLSSRILPSTCDHCCIRSSPVSTIKNVKYSIRSMQVEDIPKLHALLAENKWNMELDYLNCIFSTDPTGLLIVEDEQGNVIGHNGILKHGSHLASFGMNIVKDGYRELGIGKKLLQATMELMGDRNVGMNSLSNRVTFYEQFGWKVSSFTLSYNQGKVNLDFIKHPLAVGFELMSSDNVSFEELFSYDTEIHTVPRKRFLDFWINHKKAQSFVAVRSGKIVGYCVLRPADVGWKMYPLYADDKNVAHALFCKAVSLIPKGEDLIFTLPVENEEANKLAKGAGLVQYLSMPRLYNKWNVVMDLTRVYSVASTEYAIV
ncbi:uncharacterized protein LOC101858273 [Aplysia californica]|uniref:Uncharacterized protein LOC101858273 n=1 Tax=Aplysia californica TaxID=6500 RepID=A0ABM0JR21_APLCA|nr:uncharacterized protein LOC101858273 [Aplysia californica]